MRLQPGPSSRTPPRWRCCLALQCPCAATTQRLFLALFAAGSARFGLRAAGEGSDHSPQKTWSRTVSAGTPLTQIDLPPPQPLGNKTLLCLRTHHESVTFCRIRGFYHRGVGAAVSPSDPVCHIQLLQRQMASVPSADSTMAVSECYQHHHNKRMITRCESTRQEDYLQSISTSI